MKEYRMPLILIALTLLIVILSESNRPKQIDWSPGFGGAETKPLGGYVLRDQLEEFFPGEEIFEVDETAYEALYDSDGTIEPGANYIIVTDRLAMSVLDTRSYLEFIRDGGNGFIAAAAIEGALADSLFVDLEPTSSLAAWEGGRREDDLLRLSLEFTSPSIGEERTRRVRVPRLGWEAPRHVTLFDEDIARIVEVTTEELSIAPQQPEATARLITSLRIELGEGEIVLTSLPQTLSNVALIDEEGLRRAAVLMSYLPNRPVYWDEYYKPTGRPVGGQAGERNPMGYILSRPALYTAWVLLLGGLVLFIIFAARRRQRIIPVVEPPQNVTLDFIRTVGHLYHDEGSYHDLAVRRTTSLLEYVRDHLSLATTTIDDLFIRRLAERSGVDVDRVAILADWIRRVERETELTAADLLAYNREIEYFYATTER